VSRACGQLYEELRDSDLPVDAPVLRAAIAAAAQGKEWRRALNIFQVQSPLCRGPCYHRARDSIAWADLWPCF